MQTQPLRYRFYRVHKFVIPFVNDVTRLIATTDFRCDEAVNVLNGRLQGVIELMKKHAEHEDQSFHALLKVKGSTVHAQIEAEHRAHDAIFDDLKARITEILASQDANERVGLGHDFYLAFRQFEADNMQHINDEENVILPELHRLYTDEELKLSDAEVYANHMSADDMVHMMSSIFPYMNPDDHYFFLSNIKEAAPDKFQEVLGNVENLIDAQTKQALINLEFST